MTGLILAFAGFVQVRLATDPDPSDEPRGISGWTHAVAGEPDLDRVLVLQDDDPRRVQRSRGPMVGVTVTSVSHGEEKHGTHPLHGARVELLDAPKFEGRNWIVAVDGQEPIDPLHLAISQGSTRLTKRAPITDAKGAEIPLYLWTTEQLASRTPQIEGGPVVAAEVFAALGIADNPTAWRKRRKAALQADLAASTAAEEATQAALTRRIQDLSAPGVAEATVGIRMRYRLDMHGPGALSDPTSSLTEAIDVDAPWPIDFWVGGWDADAFCMYLRGTLTLPLRH